MVQGPLSSPKTGQVGAIAKGRVGPVEFGGEVGKAVGLEEVRGFEAVEYDHLLTVGIRSIGTALYFAVMRG